MDTKHGKMAKGHENPPVGQLLTVVYEDVDGKREERYKVIDVQQAALGVGVVVQEADANGWVTVQINGDVGESKGNLTKSLLIDEPPTYAEWVKQLKRGK